MVKKIYPVTKGSPADEKLGLTSQIRRAAISIYANLTEGSTKKSYKEQVKFTRIAYGSWIELLNHLILACDLEYITTEELKVFRENIHEISVKINNLRNSRLNNITPG